MEQSWDVNGRWRVFLIAERGQRQQSRYAADTNLQIVFSSSDPPLLLSFQKNTGQHVLWQARKANAEVSTCRDNLLKLWSPFHSDSI